MQVGPALPSTTVRRAGPADIAAISALNADVQALHAAAMPWRFKSPGPDTFPDTEVVRLMGLPGVVFLLAEVDSNSVGYVLAEFVRRPETSRTHAYATLMVHHISVRPGVRRRGVGRVLIDAAKSLAAEQNIDRLQLDVWDFNADARAFFDRCGLVPSQHAVVDRVEIDGCGAVTSA